MADQMAPAEAPAREAGLVIGAGPAGLMAAEEMARAGLAVTLADRMPSVGRKLLMAGKSGLNLTNAESVDRLIAAYGADTPLAPMLRAFDADAVRDWARGLGQETFAGSTGRVFPTAMKASPLLRAWLARLDGLGVARRTRWRWTGRDGGAWRFDTPDGPRAVEAGACVLALGGASWRRLGSDGAWTRAAEALGAAVTPFAPANAGLSVDWSGPMERFMGAPLKGARLTAGGLTSRGELTITRRGLEGGGLYAVFPEIRAGATPILDLAPDRDAAWLERRLEAGPGKASVSQWLRKAARLDPLRIALLREWGGPLPRDARIAQRIKGLRVSHDGPRPMDEAISTAGGLAWDALDEALMLRAAPGTFAAGEMLDWEAPTGGYLVTASLATGRWAGRAAADHALGRRRDP